MNKSPNEAMLSMFLEANNFTSDPTKAHAVRAIKEWFEVRRLLGIQPYAEDDTIAVLRKKLGKN